jgi:AraC-like DNA-binding protein
MPIEHSIALSRSNLRRAIRARDLIHASYGSALTLDAMAREAGLSRYFFLRLFSAVYGATPHDYLTSVRVDVAKRALAAGASVTDTCLDVGFSSLGSFSSLFARRTGLSPRDWQKRVRCTIPLPGLAQSAFVPACFLLFHGLGNFGEVAPVALRLSNVSTRRPQ